MGDGNHLQVVTHGSEYLPHTICYAPGDSCIDLIKKNGREVITRSKHLLDSEHQTSHFASRGNAPYGL